MEEEYQTGRVSRKQPYSTPTHAADGGRTAPTDARHVTRLKGARDHVIHGAQRYSSENRYTGNVLLVCRPRPLPGRAVGLASQCSTFDPRSCARIVVLHPDLYRCIIIVAAVPIPGRAAATSNALPRRETIACSRRRRRRHHHQLPLTQ